MQCRLEKPRKTKHTIESIKIHCAKEGYQVLTEIYKNPHTRLHLVCPQGHSYESRWMQFNRGERCRECRFEVMSIEKVCIALEKEGYILVSTTYKNPHIKLESFCTQGHEYNFAWAEFKKGYRCLECAKHRTISKGEKKLGEIICSLFPKEKVEYQDDLGFLGRQTVDYSVPTLGLAFEFDGEHHFKPTSYGGMSSNQAKQAFKVWIQRDIRKNELCRIHKIKLIRIAYNETLTLESVREKIGSA